MALTAASSSLIPRPSTHSVTDEILHIFSLFISSSYHHLKRTPHAEKPTSDEISPAILKSSQSYRQIMNQYLENLVSDDISNKCSSDELDQLDVIIDVINDLNKLWLATEILLMTSSETIASDVIHWLQVRLSHTSISASLLPLLSLSWTIWMCWTLRIPPNLMNLL
jgi:hypothetical protein